MKKISLFIIIAAMVAFALIGCAKKEEAAEVQETTEAVVEETAKETTAAATEEETEEETENSEPKELTNYDDYDVWGKDEEWFLENYGEPDEYEDDGYLIIMTYYDKSADYYLSEEWPVDEDGNETDGDPTIQCYEIDLKEGEDVVAYLIHPDYAPVEEEETEEEIIPNPNGPQ